MSDATPTIEPPIEVLRSLVAEGILTPEGLSEGQSIQRNRGGNIFTILVGLGHLDPAALHAHCAQQGMAGIDLANYECDEAVVQMLDEDFARQALALPVDKLGSLFTIAMACPLDKPAIEAIKEKTGLKVKPVLATYESLITALDRYYAEDVATDAAAHFRNLLSDSGPGKGGEDIREALQALPSLPAFSSTMRRLQEAMGNPKATVRHVAEVIRRDAQVSARLLAVTNSAAYGMPDSVTDIALATVLLGKGGACEIAMGGPVAKDTDKDVPFDFRMFWRRSLFCAELTQRLAGMCEGVSAPTAYSAGLLHAVGRLGMAVAAADTYAKATGDARGEQLVAAERNAFQMDYAQAGGVLALHWGLPQILIDAIGQHRSEAALNGAAPLVRVTALAAVMTDAHELGLDAPRSEAVTPIAESIGVAPDALKAIFAEAVALLQKS